jgi:VanZ family protein
VKRILLWAAVVGYASLIFYLSSLENPLPQLTPHLSDKALHAVEYGGLALLVAAALLASGVRARRAVGIAILAASLYAGTDELHQSLVPGRSCELADWIADTLGALAGGLVAFWPRRARPAAPPARPATPPSPRRGPP